MKRACKLYDKKIISCFADNELSLEKTVEISKHLETCPVCSDTVAKYRKLSGIFTHNISKQVDKIDKALPGLKVMERIKQREKSYYKKVFDYFFSKFYLKGISAAVILGILFIFFQVLPGHKTPVGGIGSSAIVNSIDGDASSIMIFETKKNRHTIIWFSEA